MMAWLHPRQWLGWVAIIYILIPAVIGTFLPNGIIRKLLWSVAALVAVMAAYNEWER